MGEFIYYRKCPTCGHLEEVKGEAPTQPVVVNQPPSPKPEKIINPLNSLEGVPTSGWK